MLSAGLQEGDIKTTGCNENPLHGTATQSESSPSRSQNDVNQAWSPPGAEPRLINLPVFPMMKEIQLSASGQSVGGVSMTHLPAARREGDMTDDTGTCSISWLCVSVSSACL